MQVSVRIPNWKLVLDAMKAISAALVFLLVMPIGARSSDRAREPVPSVKAPELPRILIDTTFPFTAGYKTVDVSAGGNLQAAINGASCNLRGTVLRLAAGAAFVGNFTLPAKSCASGQWIIIRTDVPDSRLPPPDARIQPSYSPTLAKILTSNVAPAIRTLGRADHYWFMGVEIGVANDIPMNYAVFVVGHGETSLDDLPHHIVVDRCYIHGDSTGNTKRGFESNGAYMAAINSYFENFHGLGQDTQAVAAWNSPGPIKLVNNFLEAAAENVILGGAAIAIPNLIPSDIEIRHNYFFKRLSWKKGDPGFAGKIWTVKNVMEFKNAQRVLVEGNVLENSWGQAQSGFALVFSPRSQHGTCPWATVADVTLRYNIILHSASGVTIAGEDNTGPSQTSQRFSIHDNLFLDINGPAWGGDGRLFQILTGAAGSTSPHDITISHNTAFQTGNIIMSGDTRNKPIRSLIFINNIQPHGRGGIAGSGYRPGNDAISAYYAETAITHNVMVGPPLGVSPGQYPSENFFPSDWESVKFGDFEKGDFHLKSTSRYHKAGTDGKDLGADIDAVMAAVAGVELGIGAAYPAYLK